MTFPSLRSRLLFIILAPLLLIAAIATYWQFLAETERAEDIFDRGLLSAALAISRDVAVSDGDALSPTTRRLVNNTSGGEVFYHVFAPDGVFVTGYATPPVLPKSAPPEISEPYYYEARYQGRDVRVLRFQYVTTVSDVSGVFNITVWQNADLRQEFVREVVLRSLAVVGLLMACIGLVIWFGVGLGLRPLLDLEDAIGMRSPSELEPIRRVVPTEAQGLVSTLNVLLDRVSRRISSKDEFISNAAHQLRNPVAGVLALAEAVKNAPDAAAAKKRSSELVEAARQASQLTNQLLSFERAAGSDLLHATNGLDLTAVISDVVDHFIAQIAEKAVQVELSLPKDTLRIDGDPVMIREAILNLLTNAVLHGGPQMTRIAVSLSRSGRHARVLIIDNGVGIPADKHVEATTRFVQTNGGPGSGLGLPIAARVMATHKGLLRLLDASVGAKIEMSFPLARLDQATH
ncbi:MAG: sensor histidine kinase [Pseudomonadota bacterium]